MAAFLIGTVVRLRSGGPLMTVTSIDTEPSDDGDKVWCSWFNGTAVTEIHLPAKALDAAGQSAGIAAFVPERE